MCVKLEPMIHIIGDSHAISLSRHLPKAKLHHMGDRTAHQLQNHSEELYDIVSHIRYYDKLILSFGEIDCRIHIEKASRENGLPIDDNVRITVERYMNVIDKIEQRKYLLSPIPSIDGDTRITDLFNKYLKYPSINLRDVLVGHPEYYEDKIHFNKYAPILEKIKEVI